MIKSVLLSAKLDKDPDIALSQLKNLNYPVMVSNKIDGIRCHVSLGNSGMPFPYTRKNKWIPNIYTRKTLEREAYNRLDGEITVGKANSKSVFNRTQSAIMSQDGEPDFKYWVFDLIDERGQRPFVERFEHLQMRFNDGLYKSTPFIKLVPHEYIANFDELMAYEENAVSLGWEGIMIRKIYGMYKQGRSTLKEAILIKVKRFLDAEAEILGCYEQETNTNPSFISEVGRSKRSKHQEGMVKNGRMGGFHVRDLESGVEFDLGNLSGITQIQRKTLWDGFLADPSLLLHKTVKYKFTPCGTKDKPRQPILLGFRDQIDMGE